MTVEELDELRRKVQRCRKTNIGITIRDTVAVYVYGTDEHDRTNMTLTEAAEYLKTLVAPKPETITITIPTFSAEWMLRNGPPESTDGWAIKAACLEALSPWLT